MNYDREMRGQEENLKRRDGIETLNSEPLGQGWVLNSKWGWKKIWGVDDPISEYRKT